MADHDHNHDHDEFDDLDHTDPSNGDIGAAPRCEPALERRDEVGIFPACLETVQQMLFHPGLTAEHFVLRGWKPPVVLLCVVAFFVTLFMNGLIFGGMWLMSWQLGSDIFPKETLEQLGTAQFIQSVVLAPVWALLYVVLLAGAAHGTLKLVKGAGHPFLATFRLTLYTTAAVYVVFLIPVCGVYIAIVWFLIIWTVALKALHDTSTGKAACAVAMAAAVYVALIVAWVLIYLEFFGGYEEIFQNL